MIAKMIVAGFWKTFPFEMIAEMIAHQNDREKKTTQNDRWNDRPLKWSPAEIGTLFTQGDPIMNDHFGGEVL